MAIWKRLGGGSGYNQGNYLQFQMLVTKSRRLSDNGQVSYGTEFEADRSKANPKHYHLAAPHLQAHTCHSNLERRPSRFICFSESGVYS